MSDHKDPPVEPQNYKFGVNVVDFGEMRIQRGLTQRERPHLCKHSSIVYDPKERRIWCEGCEQSIDPFDALLLLVGQYDQAMKYWARREKEVREAIEHNLISIASKEIDKQWRKKNTLPCCPNCKEPIFPEDVKAGLPAVSKELAYAKRKAQKEGE